MFDCDIRSKCLSTFFCCSIGRTAQRARDGFCVGWFVRGMPIRNRRKLCSAFCHHITVERRPHKRQQLRAKWIQLARFWRLAGSAWVVCFGIDHSLLFLRSSRVALLLVAFSAESTHSAALLSACRWLACVGSSEVARPSKSRWYAQRPRIGSESLLQVCERFRSRSEVWRRLWVVTSVFTLDSCRSDFPQACLDILC